MWYNYTCDTLNIEINAAGGAQKVSLQSQKEDHLRQAENFYASLRTNTHLAKLNATVTFDFQQNLPLPHIPVGDVFYVRQLWLYVFGVHECGSNRAVMYSWPEFIAGKGGNEVVSCLDNCLPEEVTGTGKLARHRPYGKRCPLRPFTRIPCLWQTAVRQLYADRPSGTLRDNAVRTQSRYG